MPKIWHKYIKINSLSGLWKISESIEELESQLYFIKPETFINPGRSRQWLASRILLQDLLQELGLLSDCKLLKLPSGKPILSIPGMHISISHAGDYAAVALSSEPIGVDVEKIGVRIERIRHKFMNDADITQMAHEKDLEWMHTVWSAKEAMFKYHPEGSIDFKEDLHLEKVSEGMLHAEIRKGDEHHSLQVPFEFFENYIIAWAFEKQGAGGGERGANFSK